MPVVWHAVQTERKVVAAACVCREHYLCRDVSIEFVSSDASSRRHAGFNWNAQSSKLLQIRSRRNDVYSVLLLEILLGAHDSNRDGERDVFRYRVQHDRVDLGAEQVDQPRRVIPHPHTWDGPSDRRIYSVASWGGGVPKEVNVYAV